MTTIRPQGPVALPSNPVRDARAAFFQKVSAPATAPAQTAPAVPHRTAAPMQSPMVAKAAPQVMPDRPLRPGSLIDIRV